MSPDPEAEQSATVRPHWHPKKSHRIADDGRIHALEGYRIHIERGRRNLRDARRLCDEGDCDACVHNCECLACSGWCLCETPPPDAYVGTTADIPNQEEERKS